MTEAWNYIYLILQGFADFVFNKAFIQNGVSLGLVILCIWVMSVVIRNVINLPNKSSSFRISKRDGGDY